MNHIAAYERETLPSGMRSRFVDNVNGLRMHILEAGFETPDRPCLLLLHGFPELAYSWRNIMVPLAEAGFHVIAPDQRGYGRTTGWNTDFDGDLRSFFVLNLVRDALALVSALGHDTIDCVVGHDFGSPVAAMCALVRPDVFRAVVLMSAPFDGPVADRSVAVNDLDEPDIHVALAALERPRKHYQWYYSTRAANGDMLNCDEGVADFLRAYYHHKSADWAGNKPFVLKSWTAAELAQLPTYYVMDLEATMAETVRPFMPSGEEIAACRWLPECDLQVYAQEFSRTGFQGGLQWYRCATGAEQAAELNLFAGRAIDVPACFIAGENDWGIYQKPGAMEAMLSHACTNLVSCDLVPGAGHWVQQEKPDETVRLLERFIDACA